MKKIILLTFMLIALSGCSIEYNVVIGENTAYEEVIVNDFTVETFPTPVYIEDQGASETNEIVEGVEYYDINYDNNNTYITYEFPLRNYDQSTAVNTCLSSFRMGTDNNGNYILNTSNYYSCFDMYPLIDDIVVNITLDGSIYDLIDSNADSVNGNVLRWTISRNNYQNKSIQVIYDLIETSDEDEEDDAQENKPIIQEENHNVDAWVNNNVGIVLLLVFVFLVLIIVVVVLLKKKTKLK